MTKKNLSISAKSTLARSLLRTALQEAIGDLGISQPTELLLERPAELERGDLASPVALQLIRTLTPEQRQQFHSPLDLATAIAAGLKEHLEGSLQGIIASAEAVAPGFINFRYSQQLLLEETLRLIDKGQANGEVDTLQNTTNPQLQNAQNLQSVVIEYVSPNTNKPLHIGHLRNAALGSSLSRILAAGGDEVQKAIIFNDRGLHIMKSCWGYLAAGRTHTAWHETLLSGELSDAVVAQISSHYESSEHTFSWQLVLPTWIDDADQWLTPEQMQVERLRKSDHFIGFWYQLAERFAEKDWVKEQWAQMLQCWEDSSHPQHEQLHTLWSAMNVWFYKGFEQTRERFGFGFDGAAVSYESQIYQKGKDLVVAAADQGVFERLPDGAVIARLEAAGLPDKILLRRDGTGIYMTFDIELTRQRTAGNAQRLIWVVGVDQQLYFQQLFAVAEKLGYGEQNRYHHLAHGMVRLPEGKMSSRKGLVLYGDDILDLAVDQAKLIMQETGSKERLSDDLEYARVAEAVGIGAVKWTMLSVDAVSEITFDVATSVSFKGFAGPYVQYTYARCQSVLQQAKSSIAIDIDNIHSILIHNTELQINDSEIALLRSIATYSESLAHSASLLAPHILCNYLYELCQRFNSFYAVCPIVSDVSLSVESKQLRLLLTTVTATILAEGLTLLGITAVEKM